jgi:hypothetical protein
MGFVCKKDDARILTYWQFTKGAYVPAITFCIKNAIVIKPIKNVFLTTINGEDLITKNKEFIRSNE